MTHRVFLNNPVKLLDSLYCLVRLSSGRGIELQGYLLAVDPVSDTAVLADKSSGDINIIPGVNWDSLKLLDSSESVKNTAREMVKGTDNVSLPPGELSMAKENVISWLSKNNLPSEVVGEDIIIMGSVTLQPPYTESNCVANNEIILQRVEHIIQNMPSS